MPKPCKLIAPEQAIYIKLGRAGSWEREWLENGIIRFGSLEHHSRPQSRAIGKFWWWTPQN